jgi:hypothetical protein
MPHGKHPGTRRIAMLSVLTTPARIAPVETSHLLPERPQARHASPGCLRTLAYGMARHMIHPPRARQVPSGVVRHPFETPMDRLAREYLSLSLRPRSHLIARHLSPRPPGTPSAHSGAPGAHQSPCRRRLRLSSLGLRRCTALHRLSRLMLCTPHVPKISIPNTTVSLPLLYRWCPITSRIAQLRIAGKMM